MRLGEVDSARSAVHSGSPRQCTREKIRFGLQQRALCEEFGLQYLVRQGCFSKCLASLHLIQSVPLVPHRMVLIVGSYDRMVSLDRIQVIPGLNQTDFIHPKANEAHAWVHSYLHSSRLRRRCRFRVPSFWLPTSGLHSRTTEQWGHMTSRKFYRKVNFLLRTSQNEPPLN